MDVVGTLMEQQKTIDSLRLLCQSLQTKVTLLQNSLNNLTIGNTARMGSGANAFHADRQGFWWGPEQLEGILTGVPTGTAILMDGTVYAKDGATGSFAADGGSPTVTVTKGIVTSIS